MAKKKISKASKNTPAKILDRMNRSIRNLRSEIRQLSSDILDVYVSNKEWHNDILENIEVKVSETSLAEMHVVIDRSLAVIQHYDRILSETVSTKAHAAKSFEVIRNG